MTDTGPDVVTIDRPPLLRFDASRNQLTSDEPDDGTTKVVRGMINAASRHLMLGVVIDREIHRWDLWVGPDHAVCHPRGVSPDDELPGVVVDPRVIVQFAARLIVKRTGEWPTRPASTNWRSPETSNLLSAPDVDENVRWVVVANLLSGGDGARVAVMATADGLVAGQIESADSAVDLRPESAMVAWGRVAPMIPAMAHNPS